MTRAPYTHGYYRALSPTMIATSLELAGLRPPELSEPLNYCELGMGFGVSLVAHAACFPRMHFYGNDFNSTHVDYAKTLANDAQLSNVTLLEDGFDKLLERDLPPMDFIVMQGIWSWISPRLRQVIVTFISRRLRPGGVVYVSHNALPGWCSLMPLRELMCLHARHIASEWHTPADQARNALEFMANMQRSGAAYFDSAPQVTARMAQLRLQNPNYLSHEYLTSDWQPQYTHTAAAELALAGLSYAARSGLEDHVDAFWLSHEARAHLDSVRELPLRETLRDFYLNTPFRRDLYARGATHLSARARSARLRRRRWALVTPRSDLTPEALRGRDDTLLSGDEHQHLVDALARGPMTLGELQQWHPTLQAMSFDRLQNSLLLFSGQGHVQPCVPPESQSLAQAGVNRFNSVVMARGTSDGLHHIASSATGQATGWTRLAMMQMRALGRGIVDPTNMVREMQAQGADAPTSRLQDGAARFLGQEAPMLQTLGSL